METPGRTWRVSGWHVGGGAGGSGASDVPHSDPRQSQGADPERRRSRWRAPLMSTGSTGLGSAALGSCLPSQAEEGVSALEDAESEGSAGVPHSGASMTQAAGPVNSRQSQGQGQAQGAEVTHSGWLYKHRKTRFRQQWHKRFFVLSGSRLLYYKTSVWQQEAPLREVLLTGRCRIEDTGRWTTSNKELYTFCVHSDTCKPVLVGLKHPELVAAWIEAIEEVLKDQSGGGFDTAATPLSTHGQALSSNASWASDDEADFPTTSRNTRTSWEDEEEEEEEEEDDDLEHVSTLGPHSFEPAAAPLQNNPGRHSEGVGPTPLGKSSFQGVRRRGSVGFGPPSELGGMLETLVALGSASSGIAGDGSWRLVRLANGLRFFEETLDCRPGAGAAEARPCLSAVGTVDAPCESVFRLVMDLSPASRYEWDVAYDAARVVETHDGHTDCIHYRFKSLPLGPLMPWMHLGPRDLCLRRYWQRRADGCYVVLYQSMEHRFCPPGPSCVRADFVYGGFFIAPGGTPSAPSARSIVMHVLDLNPKGWMPWCCDFPASLHFFLLGRVAGIREFFTQTRGVAVSSLLGMPLSAQADATTGPARGGRKNFRRRSSTPAAIMEGSNHRGAGGKEEEESRKGGGASKKPAPLSSVGARASQANPEVKAALTDPALGSKGVVTDIGINSAGRSSSWKDQAAGARKDPIPCSVSHSLGPAEALAGGPGGRSLSLKDMEGHHRSHSGPQLMDLAREAEARELRTSKDGASHPHQQQHQQNQQPRPASGSRLPQGQSVKPHQRLQPLESENHQSTGVPTAIPFRPPHAAMNGDAAGAAAGRGPGDWSTEELDSRAYAEGSPSSVEDAGPTSPDGGDFLESLPESAQQRQERQRQQEQLQRLRTASRGRGVKGNQDRHAGLQWAVGTGTLDKGSAVSGINCWSEAEEGLFSVRSPSYFLDKVKQSAAAPGLVLVAVDWLKKLDRIDHVVEHKETPVQAARKLYANVPEAEKPYFFIVNLQVPAAQYYSMVFYWMLPQRPQPGTLLQRFAQADDMFRNTRLKLIPRIHQGAWVVKRSVGTTPLIVAGALQVNYMQAPDYIECDVDIGSSSVANGIVRFVLGYVRTLVVDMAFLFQSNTEDELPEELLGTVRVSHLEPNAALDLDLDSLRPQEMEPEGEEQGEQQSPSAIFD